MAKPRLFLSSLVLASSALAAGCASSGPLPTVAYTVRSAKDTAPVDRALAGASLPVAALRTDLPKRSAPPPSFDVAENAISAARDAYTQARFADCTRALADVSPSALIGAGKRDLAARVLLWTAACGYPRAGQAVEKDVLAFADWNLEMPKDAQSVSPDVERLLIRMKTKKRSEPTAAVQVKAEPGVRLEVDGEPATCVTPCSVDLRYGKHVLAWSGDGVVRGFDVVTIDAPRVDRVLPVRLASPEEAQTQWVSTYAVGNAVDSPSSLRLLATALRTRRLVLLDALTSDQRLYGSLVVDGDVVARAERALAKGAEANAAPDVMNDLLVKGNVVAPPPPLWSRPLFWVAVVIAAGGAGAGAYFIAKPAPERTEVRF